MERRILFILLGLGVLACCHAGKDERAWRDDNRCGGDYVAPNGKIAECNPEGIYPCCSPYNWCGNTADHCDCGGCIDYRVTDERAWRDDNRCGGDYVAPNGKIAECNPEGIYPCCSPYNWCGNTADHCDCGGCIDYRVTDERAWRDDNRCGGDYVAPNGKIAECNPEGIYPCCSPYNWCGNTADHCDCGGCIDYRVTDRHSDSDSDSDSNSNQNDCDFSCGDEYKPICGSDGRTYGNGCKLRAARCRNPGLTVQQKGECPQDELQEECLDCRLVRIACTDKLRNERCSCNSLEVCCNNCCGGQSCVPKKSEEDTCESPRICTDEFNPICGSDGVTYGNACQFKFAKLCDNPALEIDHHEECDPCRLVDCALPVCPDGFIIVEDGPGCCPGTCKPDCSRVLCALPDCPEDSQIIDPVQPCCRICVDIDPCEGIFCDLPICSPGYIIDYDGPGCCPGCKLDCSIVLCLRPICPIGSEIVDPEEGCCPVCSDIDPCRNIVCDLPVCSDGSVLDYDGPGCCPSCTIDCRLVRCAQPVCPEGSEIVDPDEGCCPVCSEIVKKGTCPPRQLRPCILGGPDDVPGCESDADCKGSQKCCPGVCASICQNPVEDAPVCPDGSNPVYCFVRPCQFATCEAYPDATCEDNYCGGCNSEWYVAGELVNCDVCSLSVDPGPCKAVIKRWVFRNGLCEEFTYGGCFGNANNFETQSECAETCGGGCPDGSTPVDCFVRPCKFATCEAYPDATCEDNYCGGCNSEWYVAGELVDCDAPVCPDGSNPVSCKVSPCQSATCEAYPDATCEDNYCGGCNSEWYVAGELVDCDVCSLSLDPGPCKAAFKRWGFRNGLCEEFTYGGCFGNANNFETQSECAETCGGGCPDGSTPVNCFDSPCQSATCEAFPETAVCVDNYCGGCNTDWFVHGEKVDCDVCSLPIVLGPCRGSFPRWGYRNGGCELFIYGGCLGNANSFLTEADCVAACRQNVCQLPLVTGPCEALFPRWGFRDDECVKFIYGGCQGNDNNFESLTDCIDECGPN